MAENETKPDRSAEAGGVESGGDIMDDLLSRLQLTERDRWIDLVSAFLLSLAVVASAFSAWQATKWSGENSILFGEASSLRLQANESRQNAFLFRSSDAESWKEAVVALEEGNDERLAIYTEHIMRPPFKRFFDAWLELDPLNNPDAPRTPFLLEEYSNQQLDQSSRLGDEAAVKFEQGTEASTNSDDYVLSAVLFASVLFFAGISTKFKSLITRTSSLAFAVIAFSLAAAWLVSLPRLSVGL